MRQLLLIAPLLLSACAGGQGGPSNKSIVLGLESSLTGADILAKQYVNMPRCGAGNGPVCSDPTVIAQIKQAASTAYSAVTAAQSAVDADPNSAASATAVAAATSALSALEKTIPQATKGTAP